MPFERCIAAALDAKLLTDDEAADFRRTYDEETAARSGTMPPHEAAAEAARETFRIFEGVAAERRRKTFLALAAQKDIVARLEAHVNYWTGRADPFDGAVGLYDRLMAGRKGLSVEGQHDFWRNQSQAELDGAYTTWRRNLFGQRRRQPRFENIVREAFGERSGDMAAEMLVASWKRSSEMLRQAFNRFGGHIGHLEDWGLPPSHDARTIAKAGFEPWRQVITPRLDRSRMIDRRNGRVLDDAGLQDALHHVYESIVTSGWSDREPSSAGGMALANRRDDSRFLHFKSADDWFAYQKQFGAADPIDAMLAHIERMSRDVAHLQVMGPNPASMLRWVKSYLDKRAAEMGLSHKGTQAGDRLDHLYANYTRSNAAPVHPVMADTVDDLGNVLSAAQLGSAVVSAVPSDMNFQLLTRNFSGLPEMKAFASYLKQLNPFSAADRMTAIKLGLGAQDYAKVLNQQGRYIGQIFGHRWSRWFNDRTLMVSGLSPWTAAGRAGFGTDFYGHVADQAGRAFGELKPEFRAMLERYGMGEREWNDVRATAPFVRSGAKFVRPADIMARTDINQGYALNLASKLADAASTETEFAVPSSALMARAITHGVDKPGSPRAIIARSAAMYRTFGSVLLLSHGRRMMSLHNSPAKMAKYAAGLVIGSTVAGAITLQAKEIAAGRNPRRMVDENGFPDWRFVLASMIQGGGLGILGDFVYSGVQGASRTGQGLATLVGGPIAGGIADLGSAVLGSSGIGPEAQNPSLTHKNFPTRLLEFTKRYMPGGNIWYARLALEREIWDQLQSMIDPGWQTRAPAIERFYRKQFGNDYWWRRGETAPESAPDLSTAAGGQQ